MLLGVVAISAACSTTPKSKPSRVHLAAVTEQLLIPSNTVITGWSGNVMLVVTTEQDGVYFSKSGIEKLQREKILP